MDQAQGKAREIDIVAEKICKKRGSHRHQSIFIVVRLFIECKFVSLPSVFWFADRDRLETEELVCRSGPFRMDNTRTLEHHYLAGPASVAKVFASSPAKEPDNEPFYKALNQVLNARTAMRGMESFVSGLPEHNHFLRKTLEFPVVVLNSFSNLRKVNFYEDSLIEPVNSNFQLEVRYAHSRPDGASRSEFLMVDFVEFNQLGKFCESLNVDADVAAFLA